MRHWRELVRLSDDEFGTLDVAEVNLACVADFPGAAEIPFAECIDRLNHYARCVDHYTEERLPEFRQHPDVYDHSEGIFRVLCMVGLLQRVYGVRYNPAKMAAEAEFDIADTFIHGALVGEGGTCASVPVVYAAVGRRLGYPLRLVEALQHCFLRWQEPGGECFNIEINNTSFDCPPDDSYRTGRYEVTPEVESKCCLLRSKTPREELACFLKERGLQWRRYGNDRKAAESFAWAYAVAPHNEGLRTCLFMALEDWHGRVQALEPPGFPPIYLTRSPRRFPAAVPEEAERNILYLEATENMLRNPDHVRELWEPMRKGLCPRRRPVRATVTFTPAGCNVTIHWVEMTQARVGESHVRPKGW